MARVSTVILILSVLCVSALGKIAHFRPCASVSPDYCTISEVRIEPCKLTKTDCILNTGVNASMSFDFTPNFAATRLKTMVYYGTIPFDSMHTDEACGVTLCPTVAGRQQLFDYNLPLGKKLPKGLFTFDWKVWNADNIEEMCCFTTTIRLKKPIN